MAVTKTAVGTVDKKAFEELYNSFETMRILDAVGDLGEVRSEIEDPGGARMDFIRLHEMAMYLLNDDAPPGDPQPIWELVDELSSKISRCQESLEKIADMLSELEPLMPDPDEYDITAEFEES